MHSGRILLMLYISSFDADKELHISHALFSHNCPFFDTPTCLTHGRDIDRNIMDALLLMLVYQQSCSHSTRFTIIPDIEICSILHVLACKCICTTKWRSVNSLSRSMHIVMIAYFEIIVSWQIFLSVQVDSASTYEPTSHRRTSTWRCDTVLKHAYDHILRWWPWSKLLMSTLVGPVC